METRKQILSLLKRKLSAPPFTGKFKIEFAYIFGSILKKSFGKESDVDVAIFLRNLPTLVKRIDLVSSLTSGFERDMDVIILNDADVIISAQVLYNGEPLIITNEKRHLIFKVQKISEYIDFKKSRKIVEENLLKGGLHA